MGQLKQLTTEEVFGQEGKQIVKEAAMSAYNKVRDELAAKGVSVRLSNEQIMGLLKNDVYLAALRSPSARIAEEKAYAALNRILEPHTEKIVMEAAPVKMPQPKIKGHEKPKEPQRDLEAENEEKMRNTNDAYLLKVHDSYTKAEEKFVAVFGQKGTTAIAKLFDGQHYTTASSLVVKQITRILEDGVKIAGRKDLKLETHDLRELLGQIEGKSLGTIEQYFDKLANLSVNQLKKDAEKARKQRLAPP